MVSARSAEPEPQRDDTGLSHSLAPGSSTSTSCRTGTAGDAGGGGGRGEQGTAALQPSARCRTAAVWRPPEAYLSAGSVRARLADDCSRRPTL
ncbi:unnamed protein product [Boreogadus saida]